MVNVLLGVAGVLLALLLFGAGFYLGWKANDRLRAHTSNAAAQRLTDDEKRLAELERRRMEEEHRAFSAVMSYSADAAYGATGGLDELFKKE